MTTMNHLPANLDPDYLQGTGWSCGERWDDPRWSQGGYWLDHTDGRRCKCKATPEMTLCEQGNDGNPCDPGCDDPYHLSLADLLAWLDEYAEKV